MGSEHFTPWNGQGDDSPCARYYREGKEHCNCRTFKANDPS